MERDPLAVCGSRAGADHLTLAMDTLQPAPHFQDRRHACGSERLLPGERMAVASTEFFWQDGV